MTDPDYKSAGSDDPVESAFVVVSPEDLLLPKFGRVRQSRRLFDALTHLIDTGRFDLGLEAISDMDDAARRMISSLPGMDPWNELIGPFFRQIDTADYLGMTIDELELFTARRRVLMTPTFDGVALYPAFQFGDVRTLLPGLSDVLAVLDEDGLDPWDAARWLNRWSETLAGTPATVLRRGRQEAVLSWARRIRHTRRE